MGNTLYKAIKYISPLSVWINKRFIWKTKFLGEASDSTLIMDNVKDYILSIDKTRTKEQLDKELKGVDIRLFEMYVKEKNWSFSAGFTTPIYDEIFINKSMYEKGEIPYDLIVHETIHKLQNLGIKHKKYLGLIEGATDSYTHLAMNVKKSSKNRREFLNIPADSQYTHSEAIFNTLKLVLGEEAMKKFALQGDMKFISQFTSKYGNEMMDKIRTFTQKSAISGYVDVYKEIEDFKALQDEILNRVFEKKFETLKETGEFVGYFKDLNVLQNYRYREIDKEDKTLKDFYNRKLEKAKKILKEIGEDESTLDSCIYKNAEIYPYTDESEINKHTKASVLAFIYNHGMTETKLEDIKKYGFKYGDNYCIMYTIKDNPICLQCGSLHYYTRHIEDDFVTKEKENGEKIYKGNNVSILKKEQCYIADFTRMSKKGEFLDNIELQQLPLDIEKEEIQNAIAEYQQDMLEERYSGFVGFLRKIKDKFSSTKMLPEGTEEKEQPNMWKKDIMVKKEGSYEKINIQTEIDRVEHDRDEL